MTPSFGLSGLLSPTAAGSIPIAQVGAGARLASVDTAQSELLNGLIQSLTGGGSVSLTAVDYQGLSNADLNLNAILTSLQTQLSLANPQQALNANVTIPQLLTAAASAANADGNTAVATIFNNLGTQIGALAGTIRLGDLFDISLPNGNLAQAQLNALDLLTGGVQLFNFQNVLTTTSPISIPGVDLGIASIASLQLRAQVVEPPVFVIGGAGSQFNTAAIRIATDVDLVDVDLDISDIVDDILGLPLVGALANVTAEASIAELSIYTEVAAGSGTIQSINALTNAITLSSTPSIANVYLGQIADSVFFNRNSVINPATDVTPGVVGSVQLGIVALGIPLLDLTAVDLNLRSTALGSPASPIVTNYTPPYPDFDTVSAGGAGVANLVSTLVSNLELSANILGLPVVGGLNTLLNTLLNNTVNDTIVQGVLTPVLTGVVDPLLDSLGIGIGEMDLAVLGVDSPDVPTAVNDSLLTLQNRPVSAAILNNDLNPNGLAITVQIVGNPASGVVILNADNTVTYTPNAGFLGTDSFSYQITDSFGRVSNTGNVAVFVGTATANNQAPNINPDTATVATNGTVNIAVLANDTDPNGDPISIIGASKAANGTVVVNANGTITYTPNAGFTGIDQFSYGAGDGKGGVGSAMVTVTVGTTGGNTGPNINPDTANGTQGDALVVSVLANDTTPTGKALTVIGVSQPANGKAVINGDGTVTYTPNASFFGQDRFTYTAADVNGLFGGATVTITVARDNVNPVINPDTANALNTGNVVVPVLANDTDGDGDPLTISGITQPANGKAVINANGTVTYTPNAGFVGDDSFTYTAVDGFGGSGSASVTITVSNPNSSPTVNPDTADVTNNTSVTIPVLDNDTDGDGDPLTVSNVTQPVNGTVTINPDGTITYTPNAGFVGDDSFTYTASDGRGGSGSATVNVSVARANVAPVVRNDTANTLINRLVTVPVLANDTDGDGDSLTITNVSQPRNGTVVLNANGTITYTPRTGFTGTDSFTYTASDGFGGSGSATVAVTVGMGGGQSGGGDGGNRSPMAFGDSAFTEIGQPTTVNVLANDVDPDGDPLSVASVTQPAEGSVVINPDGTVTFTPNAGFQGTVVFQYTVTDGRGGSSGNIVQVVVGRAPGDGPPVIPELRQYVVGADTGGGPRVTVYNPDGSTKFNFFAYDPNGRFGVSVAMGDIDGDGVSDILTSPGFGGGPHIRVLSGKDLTPIVDFFAFNPEFRGGVSISTGDLNGDGRNDIVVAAGPGGGPHVRVIDGTKINLLDAGGVITEAALMANFFAFDSTFGGGVSVAVTDLDLNGVGELITGSGPGGPPLVRVWDVPTMTLTREFFAFDPSFSQGVNVGGRGQFIVVAAGRGGIPRVQVFKGVQQELISDFLAYEPTFTGGARVNFAETVDASNPLFLIGAGVGGGPRIRVLRPTGETVLPDYFAFEPSFRGGVYVN
ncbi:Ig-like domain-containing protein [Tuwongella immobilis]|uniref:Ig-like domain-containing protein n=1 Tax=Tuwongella immobilis TaxID=692036 RepID=UPI0013A6D028|nr:Ig-like domain-containing protein [Tuwongella immobilis]